jgi:hypothetical protein
VLNGNHSRCTFYREWFHLSAFVLQLTLKQALPPLPLSLRRPNSSSLVVLAVLQQLSCGSTAHEPGYANNKLLISRTRSSSDEYYNPSS